jgi:hypothetical protein
MAAVGALGPVVPPHIYESGANRVNPLDEYPVGLARISERNDLPGAQAECGYDE